MKVLLKLNIANTLNKIGDYCLFSGIILLWFNYVCYYKQIKSTLNKTKISLSKENKILSSDQLLDLEKNSYNQLPINLAAILFNDNKFIKNKILKYLNKQINK